MEAADARHEVVHSPLLAGAEGHRQRGLVALTTGVVRLDSIGCPHMEGVAVLRLDEGTVPVDVELPLLVATDVVLHPSVGTGYRNTCGRIAFRTKLSKRSRGNVVWLPRVGPIAVVEPVRVKRQRLAGLVGHLHRHADS